jgi:ABC-type amino acid transport system permease subunit
MTISTFRWIGLIIGVLAVVCRLAARHIPIDLAVAVTPQLHRGIPIGVVLFWFFLTLSAVMIGISFLKQTH